MTPTRYPMYIISKGRADTRMTSRTLEEMKQPYRIVIEEQEYDQYAAVIDPKKILVLPFKNLGLGGIPARNWVWEHSIREGHAAHWILDDNIRHFFRLFKNTKLRVNSNVPFRVCEDLKDRYTNVKMAGLNYSFFQPTHMKKPAVYVNTRIYSCILLDNDTKHRWRVLEWEGKPAPYNEDTDLSLLFLKDGDCTILLNHFCAGKMATMKTKGGNTAEVYKVGANTEFDNRYKFAASLHAAHPDVVEMTQKWGRYHHHVDYSQFQKNNILKLKPGIIVPREVNNYGLKLVKLSDSKNICSDYEILNTDNYLEVAYE